MRSLAFAAALGAVRDLGVVVLRDPEDVTPEPAPARSAPPSSPRVVTESRAKSRRLRQMARASAKGA